MALAATIRSRIETYEMMLQGCYGTDYAEKLKFVLAELRSLEAGG